MRERIKYGKPRWYFIQSHFPDCECVLRNCPVLWDAINSSGYSAVLFSCCMKTCILSFCWFFFGGWGLRLGEVGFVFHHKETEEFCLWDGKSTGRKHPFLAIPTLPRFPVSRVSPSYSKNQRPVMPREGGKGVGVWWIVMNTNLHGK